MLPLIHSIIFIFTVHNMSGPATSCHHYRCSGKRPPSAYTDETIVPSHGGLARIWQILSEAACTRPVACAKEPHAIAVFVVVSYNNH